MVITLNENASGHAIWDTALEGGFQTGSCAEDDNGGDEGWEREAIILSVLGGGDAFGSVVERLKSTFDEQACKTIEVEDEVNTICIGAVEDGAHTIDLVRWVQYQNVRR